MGLLRDLFGLSKKEIWKELSSRIGAEFQDGGFLGRDKVVARIRGWTITLDTYAVSTGKSTVTYTRIRAPYVSKDGFRFKIYRAGFFSRIGKLLGMQDITVGFTEFDEEFITKGNDEDKLRALLSNTKIRQLIELQPRFHLEVRHDKGWFGEALPEGVGELCFRVP